MNRYRHIEQSLVHSCSEAEIKIPEGERVRIAALKERVASDPSLIFEATVLQLLERSPDLSLSDATDAVRKYAFESNQIGRRD